MPKWIPHKCRVCGVERSETQIVSRRGLCPTHAIANVVEAVRNAQETGRIGGGRSGEVRRGEIPHRRPKGVGDTPTPPDQRLTSESAGQAVASN